MTRILGALLVASTLAVAAAGCGGPKTLHVADIQLGRSLNADNSVREHTTAFNPQDSIYLSVITDGRGSATLSVRWTLAGRLLDEAKKPVSYTDAAATDFGLKTGSGFPPGPYAAEVFLDGQPVGSRKFRVEERR